MFRLVKISGIQTSTLKKQGCTFIIDFIRQFATDCWISILKGCHIYNQEQQKKNDAEGIALPAKMFRLVKISGVQTSAINNQRITNLALNSSVKLKSASVISEHVIPSASYDCIKSFL
jgi:hypothetical protein